MRDLGYQSGALKQPLDILAGVAIAAVQLESIVEGRGAAYRVLERKDQ
jgi:hypothetical protein